MTTPIRFQRSDGVYAAPAGYIFGQDGYGRDVLEETEHAPSYDAFFGRRVFTIARAIDAGWLRRETAGEEDCPDA